MFCENCGHQISDTAKFCSACGHPVGTAPSPGVGAPPTVPAKRESPRLKASSGNGSISRMSGIRRIKIDFSVLSAPAFWQHPVGRELRAGRKRSSYAAAISCKGDCCQHLTESVIVKIYFFKGVTGALCIYPKAIIE